MEDLKDNIVAYTGAAPSLETYNIPLTVRFSDDHKKMWINAPTHCVFRASGINNLIIHDDQLEFTEVPLCSSRLALFLTGALVSGISAELILNALFKLAPDMNLLFATTITAIGAIVGYLTGRHFDRKLKR